MSNTSNKILSALKEFYQEINNEVMGGEKGIDQFLFLLDNRSTEAEFNLDKLVVQPHGVAFRHPDSQSIVRSYTPGTGIFYDIPHASEKTPITEKLRDSIIAGASGTGFSESNARLMSQIMVEHTVAHTTTRWKYAIDTMRTGKFTPLGAQGDEISGLEIDFSRDASLDITADLTDSDVDFDVAMKALYDAYRAKGGNPANLTVIMGTDWLYEMQTTDDVLTRMQANAANVLIRQNMNPPKYMGVNGLYFVGEYLIPGTFSMVTILGYEPQDTFVAYKGATAEVFFPTDEALMFSSGDKRYRVFGGIDALDDSKRAVRVAGSEIVFDSYNSFDPVTEFIRSQTRLAFIPANIDHVARSTGTFTSES